MLLLLVRSGATTTTTFKPHPCAQLQPSGGAAQGSIQPDHNDAGVGNLSVDTSRLKCLLRDELLLLEVLTPFFCCTMTAGAETQCFPGGGARGLQLEATFFSGFSTKSLSTCACSPCMVCIHVMNQNHEILVCLEL